MKFDASIERPCRGCRTTHAFTNEFWKPQGRSFVCRARRKISLQKHSKTTKFKNVQRRWSRTSKGKACSKRGAQRNWDYRMVVGAAQSDRKRGLLNPNAYIDREFIQGQFSFQRGLCFYCGVTMKYGVGVDRKANPDAVTIERIDNRFGHAKNNCVLACAHCNQSTKSHPNRKHFHIQTSLVTGRPFIKSLM